MTHNSILWLLRKLYETENEIIIKEIPFCVKVFSVTKKEYLSRSTIPAVPSDQSHPNWHRRQQIRKPLLFNHLVDGAFVLKTAGSFKIVNSLEVFTNSKFFINPQNLLWTYIGHLTQAHRIIRYADFRAFLNEFQYFSIVIITKTFFWRNTFLTNRFEPGFPFWPISKSVPLKDKNQVIHAKMHPRSIYF